MTVGPNHLLDLIRNQFDDQTVERLSGAAGLGLDGARRALGTVLPVQLGALAERVQAPGGAQTVMDLAEQYALPGGMEAGDPERLRTAGQAIQAELFGTRAGEVARQVAQESGVPEGGLSRLMQMAMPLVLAVVGGQARAAGGTGALTGLLGGLLGPLNTLLPAGLKGLLGGASTGGLVDVPDRAPAIPATPSVQVPGAPAAPAGNLLDLIRGAFGGDVAGRLGALAGLSGTTASQAVGGALPLLLDGMAGEAQVPGGAGRLFDLASRFRGLGNPAEALAREGAAQTLTSEGDTALSALLGSRQNAVADRLAGAVGAPGGSVLSLLRMLAPLLLGFIGSQAAARGLNAGGLAGLLGGLRGQLSSLLPSGLGALGALLGTGAVGAGLSGAAPAPTMPTVTRPEAPTAPATPLPERRGGAGWWWLVPILLLLGLGGCWLLSRNQPATSTAGALTISEPSSGASLPAGAFTISGSGPAGASVEVMEGGSRVGDAATVGADGAWSVAMPAPTPAGEHTYQVRSGSDTADLKVMVGAASTGQAPPTGTGLAIGEPASGATLPAGEFTLTGTGQAGDELEVFEDGTSLGKATVGADGSWSQAVPSPSAGKHSYEVRGKSGTATLAVTVGAASASSGDCTKAYSLSLKSGQTMREPFRFGGVGSGKSYLVTVRRGDRTIGTKTMPLDATCGWSYTSKPGPGQITYEVRSAAGQKALSVINLTVSK